MRAIAWLVVRLRWPIVVGWIAVAVAAVVYLPTLEEAGDDNSLLGLVPQDAEALAAGERSAELFDVPVITHTAVVQRDPDGLPRSVLERSARQARDVANKDDPGLRDIAGAFPIANVRGFVPGARERGTTVVTYLFFDPAETDLVDQDELAHRYADRLGDDAVVGVTGAVPARMEEWRQIAAGLPWVTAATIALIALILGIHFRSPIAPFVTLAAAGVAYVVALRTVARVGGELDVVVPRDAEPVLVVLLLGVVTDYAVFFLHGFRERLTAGEERLKAAQHATAEYLPIVATAGLIVAGGTLALVAGRLEFFRAFGPGMALTVLVGLLVAITFVPAALAILGGRTFWPWRAHDAEPPRERPSRIALFATRRPVALVIAAAAVAVLAVAGRGVLETELGISQIRGLPGGSEPKRAAQAAEDGFAPGILSPTVLLVEGVDRRLDLPGLVRLERSLAAEPGVAGVIGPATQAARSIPGLVFGREDAARYLVVLDEEPQEAPAIRVVQRLRQHMPALLEDAGLPEQAHVRFAGDTALADETVATISHDLVRIGIAAFAVTVLLLVLFLRAILAPLYLVAASTLALVASIGATTLLFQRVLGHNDLTYHVPFAVAVLLLALGSDYNVFVVGRIWSHAERMPLREAIATAAPRASRAISVAGVALALSFAALALIDLRQFREFAFAMLVGVLLDAFLVRSLLIPALISLFAERSWWPWRRRAAALDAA